MKNTARSAAPALPTVSALDADGEEFTLDFGFPEVSTAKPATPAPAVDAVEGKLAAEAVSNGFRREWYADRGLLPR